MSNPLSDLYFGLKYYKTQNFLLYNNGIEEPYLLALFDPDLKSAEFIVDNKNQTSTYELCVPIFQDNNSFANNTVMPYYLMPALLTKFVNYLLYSFKNTNLLNDILDYSGLKNSISSLNLNPMQYNMSLAGFSYLTSKISDGLLIIDIMRNININYINMLTTYVNYVYVNSFITIPLADKLLNLMSTSNSSYTNTTVYDIINLGITNLSYSSYIGYQLSFSSMTNVSMLIGDLAYMNANTPYIYSTSYSSYNLYSIVSNSSVQNTVEYAFNTVTPSFLLNSVYNQVQYMQYSQSYNYGSPLYTYPIIGIGGIVEEAITTPSSLYYNQNNMSIYLKSDVFTYNLIKLLNLPNIQYQDTINNITYNFSYVNANSLYNNFLLNNSIYINVLKYNTFLSTYSFKSAITEVQNIFKSIKTSITVLQISNISTYLSMLDIIPQINYSFKLIVVQEIPSGTINY